MCEGVSCSLFWGRNFSARVEWCGGENTLKYINFCILTALWPRPAQTLAQLDIATCCTLFCRNVSAGFSQRHECDQWEPCTFCLHCLSYTLRAWSTKTKTSCSLPANRNVILKWLPFKRLSGRSQATRMSANSMAVSQDWYRESTGTSVFLVLAEWHAEHPFPVSHRVIHRAFTEDSTSRPWTYVRCEHVKCCLVTLTRCSSEAVTWFSW